MLQIVPDDGDLERVVLTLQGIIVAEWAELLELECAELVRAGYRVALDLGGVVFIGRSGFEALSRLSRMGVAIMGCPPLIADALEKEGIEITRPSGLPAAKA